jgi:hypothetical protein
MYKLKEPCSAQCTDTCMVVCRQGAALQHPDLEGRGPGPGAGGGAGRGDGAAELCVGGTAVPGRYIRWVQAQYLRTVLCEGSQY